MKAYECKDKVYLYVSSMRIKKLQIKLNSNHYPWSEAQKDVAKKKKKLSQLSTREISPIFVDTIYLILD